MCYIYIYNTCSLRGFAAAEEEEEEERERGKKREERERERERGRAGRASEEAERERERDREARLVLMGKGDACLWPSSEEASCPSTWRSRPTCHVPAYTAHVPVYTVFCPRAFRATSPRHVPATRCISHRDPSRGRPATPRPRACRAASPRPVTGHTMRHITTWAMVRYVIGGAICDGPIRWYDGAICDGTSCAIRHAAHVPVYTVSRPRAHRVTPPRTPCHVPARYVMGTPHVAIRHVIGVPYARRAI